MQPICRKDRSHSSVIGGEFCTIAILDLHCTYTPPEHSWVLSFLLYSTFSSTLRISYSRSGLLAFNLWDFLTADSSYSNIQLDAAAFAIPTCTVVDGCGCETRNLLTELCWESTREPTRHQKIQSIFPHDVPYDNDRILVASEVLSFNLKSQKRFWIIPPYTLPYNHMYQHFCTYSTSIERFTSFSLVFT